MTTEPEEREPRDCAETESDDCEPEESEWDRGTRETEEFLSRERHR